jgi:hypothetical protein
MIGNVDLDLENVEDHLLIKLPIHPSTIEKLALIRFWLLKLSQAHFEVIYAFNGILNPEFLSVLNPRMGPRKIMFHANDMEVNFHHIKAIPSDFAQFLCAREIFIRTSLHDEQQRNKFITGTGKALEKFCIDSHKSNQNQGEFCEFLVKVSFEIHFYNFQI